MFACTGIVYNHENEQATTTQNGVDEFHQRDVERSQTQNITYYVIPLIRVQTQSHLVYNNRRLRLEEMVVGSEWEWVGWGFWRPDVILIIDLGAGSMSVFPLGKFIKYFSYGMLYFN